MLAATAVGALGGYLAFDFSSGTGEQQSRAAALLSSLGEWVDATIDASGFGDCRIKGNISDRGERIYHVPGGEYYFATRVEFWNGERWFCTEEDAVKAGWRPSLR